MGSGASASELKEAIDAASVADIKSAIANLRAHNVLAIEAALNIDTFIVPEKVSMCDEVWFTRAFRKAGILDASASVESIDMKVLGADQGLTSDTALVELTYTSVGTSKSSQSYIEKRALHTCYNGKIHLRYDACRGDSKIGPKACVVKLPEKNSKLPKETLNLMFQAEIDVYRHLTADFASKGMMLPELYFSASPEDPCTEGYVMVMEHMTHASREPCLQVGSMFDGVPMECALLAVKELACLHSAYWDKSRDVVRAFETGPGKPRFPQSKFAHIDDEGKKSWYATGFKQRIAVTTAVFGPNGTAKLTADDPEVEGFRNLGAVVSTFEPVVKRRLGVFLKRLKACPMALTHGDCHIENLFIRPGENPAAMWFDFGTLGFRPAVWDLALFVIASLEPGVRADNEENLVKCYHESLVAKGIGKYTFEQCLSDYRFCACAGFWNIGGLIVALKEVLANEKFPVRRKANILTKRVAAALEAAKFLDFFKDGPEDSEEQHPLKNEEPLNFE